MRRETGEIRSLDSIRVFGGLTPDCVRLIERRCDWRDVLPGQEIVAHLDASRRVGFLVSGRARQVLYAASGTVVGFGELLPGAMFGEIAAIDGVARAIAVEAVEACVVASLDHRQFLALVRDEPAFATALLTQICHNIRELTARVVEFSTMPVNARVQAELLRLAHSKGVADGNRIMLTNVPTHAEFAARVSTHREAVTREINRLVKLGLLAKHADGLAVMDMAGLSALVRKASGV